MQDLLDIVKKIRTKNGKVINIGALEQIEAHFPQWQNLESEEDEQSKIGYRLGELQKFLDMEIKPEDSVRINRKMQKLTDDINSGSIEFGDMVSDLHLCFLGLLDSNLAIAIDKFEDSLHINETANENLKQSLLFELLNAPLNDILKFMKQRQPSIIDYYSDDMFIDLKRQLKKSGDDISSDLLYPILREIDRLEQDIYNLPNGTLINLLIRRKSIAFPTAEQLKELHNFIRSSTSGTFDDFRVKMGLNFISTEEEKIFSSLFHNYFKRFKDYDTQVTNQLHAAKPCTMLPLVGNIAKATWPTLSLNSTEDPADTEIMDKFVALGTLSIGSLQSTELNYMLYAKFGSSDFESSQSMSSISDQSDISSITFGNTVDKARKTLLIEGMNSLQNVIEFKPDPNEPNFFVFRLRKQNVNEEEGVTKAPAALLTHLSTSNNISDSLVLSVAYGHLLVKFLQARSIDDLEKCINDPKRRNCIQLHPTPVEEFSTVFSPVTKESESYILHCHQKSSSQRLLFGFNAQKELEQITESEIREVCYVRSSSCEMDRVCELCSHREHHKNSDRFKELVRSAFISEHSTNILSDKLSYIKIDSQLLKPDVLPYKLTMEADLLGAHEQSWEKQKSFSYQYVKMLENDKCDSVEFSCPISNQNEQELESTCEAALKLAKTNKSTQASADDNDRYFTWN